MTTPSFQSSSWVAAPPFALPAQTINSASILGLPAAWRAINLIADAVATCAPRVMDGFQQVPGTFVDRPNTSYTPYEFWFETAAQLLLHGNAVHYILWNDNGTVDQLVPMPTVDVHCRLVDGFPVYELYGNEYRPDQVLHIRGLTVPGNPWGVGVIEAHRRGLSIGLDQLALQSNQLRTGGVPRVVVQLPVNASNFTPEMAERVQQDFTDSFAQAQSKPAIIPSGMSITPLSMSNGDLEFLASRAFSIAEVAFMFGLDPSTLNASIAPESNNMTYANLEAREAAKLKDIAPWFQRIEQKLTDLLPSGVAKFVPEKVLRADTASRYTSYSVALAGGWLTVDDVRRLEGLPPLENV